MNTLVLYPNEIGELCRVTLYGERLTQVAEAHPLSLGYRLKASVLGGGRGVAEVTAVTAQEAHLQLEITDPPLPRQPLSLIVAVSRPQTIKKVVQAGTLLGVSEIVFVRTDYTDPNYLTSRELSEERLNREIVLGLEQCGDSVGPRISVAAKFHHLFERLPSATIRCFGHTLPASGAFPALPLQHGNPAYGILAIGPERGWSEREVDRFVKEGFHPISFGPRILRVDSATYVGATLLAQALERTDTSVSGI